ncbi:hypothetical protein BYT27DRAFT_7155573 [Phlegmacium glaucopus]|nr:hypothetical protein BYT27DRAFT_7155573 [Phlegmacium glaucopus]
MRIWRLSGRNIYLTGSSVILVAASFGTYILYIAKAAQLKDLPSLATIKSESIAVNVLSAATDLLIAAILCTLLNLSRTGFQKSDTIINKLILFSVNTGLITSICALASMVSILVAGNTFIYIASFLCLGLYTNSLLSTLNVRKMIRGGSDGASVNAMSLSLRGLPKDSTQVNYIHLPVALGGSTVVMLRLGSARLRLDTASTKPGPSRRPKLCTAWARPGAQAAAFSHTVRR